MPVLGILLSLLLLSGCSENEAKLRYSYLRSASDFSVDTVSADLFCDDPGPNFITDGFDAKATCRNIKKFMLTWEKPEDTEDFTGYRLYLDTTPTEAAISWRATQSDEKHVSVVINETAKLKDSLVFFFFDKNKPPAGIRAVDLPDTLQVGRRRVFGLDTNGRLEDKLNRFVFALATRYGGSRTQGQPQYTVIITTDKFPPNPFNPKIVPGSDGFTATWARPNDVTSFFNPALDSGVISGYVFTLMLAGKPTQDRSNRFKPEIKFRIGGVEKTGDFLDSVVVENNVGPVGHHYFLPDGGRAGRVPDADDTLKVVVSGLSPQENLDITIFAIDSAGNDNDGSVPSASGIFLTDTTQPTTPKLEVPDSLTGKNSFVVRWTASRDRLDKDGNGTLEEGDTPNFRIARYRLTRALQRPAGEKADPFDRRDTVVEVTQSNESNEVFTDTVRFLPPGKTYKLFLTAEDSTGYASETDSVIVSTDSIVFAGADSGFTCPPGMVPIPAASFRLGDSATAAPQDERGGRIARMESFCIEPFEHRDSTGAFAVRMTWEEANEACKEISSADESMLCSEAQWERACEGFDVENPHPHGIQSERSPAILQSSCNQGTADSAMAMSFELRNPICLTNEGVYDMAGNLSEWVRDPYNPGAYAATAKDTVMGHGYTFPAGSGDTARVHTIRGGNYLKPNLPVAQIQGFARCSNRDFPMQVRPLFREDCKGEKPQIAVTYGEGLQQFRCLDIPEEFRDNQYSEVILARKDSTKVVLFRSGSQLKDTVKLDPILDSTLRGRKPTDVRFTTRALAEVVFVNAADSAITDYLDAKEMKDTTQAGLRKILDRESPSQAWKARMVDGRYQIRFWYAHTLSGSAVAKEYYASRNVGFRCCSKPRPPAPPAVASNP